MGSLESNAKGLGALDVAIGQAIPKLKLSKRLPTVHYANAIRMGIIAPIQ